jgi:Flp pilus assembly protein TadG
LIRRRRPGCDRGSFTAEFAAGLPALVVLLLAGLTAVGAVTTKAQCVDAAREGALAAARGESAPAAVSRVGPDGAGVTVDLTDDTASVAVETKIRVLGGHLPVITIRSTAVAAREPEAAP